MSRFDVLIMIESQNCSIMYNTIKSYIIRMCGPRYHDALCERVGFTNESLVVCD